MVLHLNKQDEGKAVVTSEGREIGVIDRYEDGTAYVQPRELVPGTTRRKLDWNDDDGPHKLRNTMVHSITEETVRIRR